MDRSKAGMIKVKNTTLLRNNGGLLYGLQRNALASLVHDAFIASDEIVSATHLQIQYHTADEHAYR